MADVHNKAIRSKNMAAISGRDTGPEMLIRKALHSRGYRYRLHDKRLAGKPDMVLPKYKAVIFIHGCFWHGHSCHLFKWPATRESFWRKKIEGNRERDASVIAQLEQNGWRVLTIWECGLKGKYRLDQDELTETISEWIKQGTSSLIIQGEE